MNTRAWIALLACLTLGLGLGLAFTACTPAGGGGGAGDTTGDGTGDGDGATAGQTGTLRVLITDKPYPLECIEEAFVTITRVEARRAGDDDAGTNGGNGDATTNGNGGDATTNGNGSASTNGNGVASTNGNGSAGTNGNGNAGTNGNGNGNGNGDNGDGNPFIVISDQQQDFNLLELQGGQTDLLGEATIPAGTYTMLRLIVTEGRIKLTDGREFDNLTVPSGEQTGIKLHLTFDVAAEGETVLLLDVDLSRAFKPTPGSPKDCTDEIREFKFQPSLAMRLIEVVDAASISGTVTADDVDALPIEDALVTAYKGDEEITSTATDADGKYTLLGLPAGEYGLEFSAAGFQDAEVTGQVVEAGDVLEGVDVVMTPDGG
ncbi:MAG TPA: DUF4382 domain-containing protein [Phycisphaerae bacterium]|nr:DUF4382 domain-containing protein [Phycisphaerae bacterium]